MKASGGNGEDMEEVRRPAVRVVCVDRRQRILLLKWRDPFDGSYLWEPPGGGIEPGERPIDAARRELWEETGFPGAAVVDRHVTVPRDVVWNGRRYRGDEAFFLAKLMDPMTLNERGLRGYEKEWLRGHAWVHRSEIGALPDRVEPPGLSDVLAALDPGIRS